MAIESQTRESRGKQLAKLDSSVRRIDEHNYVVRSQSGNGEYQAINTELGFIRSCSDHVYPGVKCKHIYALEFSYAFRNKVKRSQTVIKPINMQACSRCQSDNIVKHGI